MHRNEDLPTAVLICHEQDRLDTEGLASWLANTLALSGLIIIRDPPGRLWRAARREIRRVGILRFLDVVAFRAYARLRLTGRDAAWTAQAVRRLRERYPMVLHTVPRLVVSSPNSAEARAFLTHLRPDVAVARCKVILKPEIFEVPRIGTFVMHPGICPEYRNAHGCFWALVNRDLDRVGMTLLRVDAGIDTGPILLHGGCEIDEVSDSHVIIQHRAVIRNLEEIGRILLSLCRGERVSPLNVEGRTSATWGQPRLTAYFRWKRAARRHPGGAAVGNRHQAAPPALYGAGGLGPTLVPSVSRARTPVVSRRLQTPTVH